MVVELTGRLLAGDDSDSTRPVCALSTNIYEQHLLISKIEVKRKQLMGQGELEPYMINVPETLLQYLRDLPIDLPPARPTAITQSTMTGAAPVSSTTQIKCKLCESN